MIRLPDKFRRNLHDFEYRPALGLSSSESSVSLRLDIMNTIDCSQVPAAQQHQIDTRVRHSPGMTSDESTKTFGFWVICNPNIAAVAQTDLLKVQASPSLTQNSIGDAHDFGAPRNQGTSISHQTRSTCRLDEEKVIVTCI